MNLTRLLWENLGRPARKSSAAKPATSFACYQCGLPCDSGHYLVDDAIPMAMFTGWSQVARPDSSVLCVPCGWVLEGNGANSVRGWQVVARSDKEMAAYVPKVADDPDMQGKPAPFFGPHALLTKRIDEVVDWRTFKAVLPENVWVKPGVPLILAEMSGDMRIGNPDALVGRIEQGFGAQKSWGGGLMVLEG